MCKANYLYAIFTVTIIMINTLIVESDVYLYLWSFLLIPAIRVVQLFPSWKTVFLTSVAMCFLEVSAEVFQHKNDEARFLFVWNNPSLLNATTITIIFFILAGSKIRSFRSIKTLEEQVIVDSLMGIYNRRYFNSYMEKNIPVFRKTKKKLLLITIDIDHFKNINDTYGHVCGDEVLLKLSEVIKASVRQTDQIYRMGGEEVAIILPNVSLDEGKAVAERLRETIEFTDFECRGKKISVTVSLGVAQYAGETVLEFMEKADVALYKAKKGGRNRVAVYSTVRESFATPC